LRLSAFERCIVERIDEVASLPQIMSALRARFPDLDFDEDDVHSFLDDLVSLDMAVSDSVGRYLGLALMTEAMQPLLERASRRDTAPARRISRAPSAPAYVHA
jgi:hypothetical protein